MHQLLYPIKSSSRYNGILVTWMVVLPLHLGKIIIGLW
jgi:hypothetical protein